MSDKIKRVSVYCASSDKISEAFFECARQTAKVLVQNQITALYGGGAVGLMGTLADTMIENGGNIIGIIPGFMREVEWQHPKVSEMIVTEDMHERKKLLLQDVDGLITLPGGCGTLEELMEAITLKRLGIFTKPIIILNVNGYYDPLVEMLERCISEKFMREVHRDMWTVVRHPNELIRALEDAPSWDRSAIDFAAV